MANGIVKKVPEDLVNSVLLRLPVKTLMRFKCVYKAWYSNVQSSTFISLHLNRTTRVNDEFILFTNSIKEEPNRFKVLLSFMSIDNDGDDLHPISPDLDMLYLTTISSNLYRRPLGPCRGLIVLTDKVNAIIFNPATRHYRLLRPSPFGCPLGFHRSIEDVGFGFDSIANEYKIVRVSEVQGEPPFNDFNMRERKVDVYELSMDSWRELNFVEQQLPQVDRYPCSEMFYKGASHWFGNTNMGVILCFDMST
ncbi:PREDICTED: F-box protein CPR30-like [Nicotiana attenuata]|uniref:F-box protein cpr30 n=1 Tax=Nicotiana attenuata TaxID=49451 RepID=A0A1J6IV60_NICAT|nr:PREDICTED: F-box protein CPR30-like [Nicotiana attenuata]OIT08702.1 f-box protein cpr30 [Nicotiana attenuata]